MRRPLLLDLFCGAGGAAMGYYNAGFRVIGVDINPMPRYPFEFHLGDAFEYLASHGHEFDAAHASPPCQHYSDLAHRNKNADDWPDLLSDVRTALALTGRPYVIENVEGAPLSNPIWLCGVQFPGLRVIRHRGFESNFSIPSLPHEKHPLVYTRDKRKSHYGELGQTTSFVSVNGGGNCSVAAASRAMGIGWMTKAELNEAIPPRYTEYVGKFLMSKVVR